MTSTTPLPAPSSSPAVAVALARAGVRAPPQMQQVWLWVKDHPHATIKDIGATLTQIPATSITSVVAQLVARKMLVAKPQWSDRARRDLAHYTAAGKAYELLPDTRQKPVGRATSVALAPVVLAPVPVRSAVQEMTDRLTVGEARAVYEVLHRMFGRP
jgi:hypothetical protein